jgi:hypothetical protein
MQIEPKDARLSGCNTFQSKTRHEFPYLILKNEKNKTRALVDFFQIKRPYRISYFRY